MKGHQLSEDDRSFRESFETARLEPAAFRHREHLRLAYAYLVENDPEAAVEKMREALLAFLRIHGIDPSKYHETMTRAWILAVRHFMEITPPCASADAFIDANPRMLDPKIMLTHYSADLLFSPQARERFVEPDLQRIPNHEP
ncbi:MAG TPA: hypothetical protein VFW45_12010 [Candidatus Polarisedimenticolia bacterium]|nr:hypothetical protein [Candidatus Polarisedimenticolia bacterium]